MRNKMRQNNFKRKIITTFKIFYKTSNSQKYKTRKGKRKMIIILIEKV